MASLIFMIKTNVGPHFFFLRSSFPFMAKNNFFPEYERSYRTKYQINFLFSFIYVLISNFFSFPNCEGRKSWFATREGEQLSR